MKKILCIVMALAMILALCACGSSKEQSDSEYIKSKGTLVVGITDFEPMDYRDASGNWIGFDADMAKAFAEYLGVKVEFVEIEWDNKVLELNNKSIDCVWNGMTLTEEVTNTMSCGKAYCDNAQVVVLAADIANSYPDAASLSALNFAVENGSAGMAAADDCSLTYTAVDTQARALMEVASGTSDACIIDLLMASAMTGEGTAYPDLLYTLKLTSEQYGCGFRKGGDMAEIYNEFYAKAFADGTVTAIAATYGIQGAVIG